MTLADIERLQGQALKQQGWEIGTCLTITPGELAELCRLARLTMALESAEAAREG